MTILRPLLRRAGTVVASVAAAIAMVAVPAAAGPPNDPGLAKPDAAHHCHFEEWGGTFVCGSQDYWYKPDHYVQVFVVGLNGNVYTKWASDAGVFAWLNMGGHCYGNPGVAVWSSSSTRWRMAISCQSSDNGFVYHRKRYDDGRWDPAWIRGIPPNGW